MTFLLKVIDNGEVQVPLANVIVAGVVKHDTTQTECITNGYL